MHVCDCPTLDLLLLGSGVFFSVCLCPPSSGKPSSAFLTRSTWKASVLSPRTSGSVFIQPSRPTDSLTGYRISSWKLFSFRIAKTLAVAFRHPDLRCRSPTPALLSRLSRWPFLFSPGSFQYVHSSLGGCGFPGTGPSQVTASVACAGPSGTCVLELSHRLFPTASFAPSSQLSLPELF